MADNNYAVSCSTVLKNVGLSDCVMNAGFDQMHILVPRGFSIATKTLAETLSTWTDAIKAAVGSRIYPLAPSVKQEFSQDEAVYEALSQGAEAYLYTNTLKDTFYISAELITPTFNSNMQHLNNGVWACYIVTSTGMILGKSSDGIKFEPFNCSFRVLPQRKATDAEGAHLPYTLRLESYADRNLYGAVVQPTDWNPLTSLEGLLDVNLTLVGSATATDIVVDVKTDLNAIGVTGLAAADFSFIKASDGTAQTPTGMTESTTVNGRYAFTFAAAVTGSVNLVAASALTVPGYESTGSLSFTI